MTRHAGVWMPLYIADYLRDTTHLSTEQHGAYMLLLMAAWDRGGILANDDQQLAAIARMTLKDWRRVSPVLRQFFATDPAGLSHKRVKHELERAQNNSERRSKAGAKGAQKRWQTDGNANGIVNGKRVAN